MQKTLILYFHSISPLRMNCWYKSYLTISVGLLEKLVRHFLLRGFNFVTLEECCYDNCKIEANKTIVLTFDDGYLDNYNYVFPLLKKYGAKATIFVSPDFVDPSESPRHQSHGGGFLSWAEMREMEASGLVDIQSHTMTHSKVYSSDYIREFHNPGSDWLYPVTNLFPEYKPFYIGNESVKNLLPFGTPFFTETSALTTRIVEINPSFTEFCVQRLQDTNWSNYSFQECFSHVHNRLSELKDAKQLIVSTETEENYKERVRWEIEESKRLIEENLQKEVSCICWPHGDYNQLCVDTAYEVGYKIVHAVAGKGPVPERSFSRMGVTEYPRSTTLSALRIIAKVEALRGRFPYTCVSSMNSLVAKARNNQ